MVYEIARQIGRSETESDIMRPSKKSLLALVALVATPLRAASLLRPLTCARVPAPAMMGDSRRTSRVGQMVQAELATVIRQGDVRGKQKIPDRLNEMISIVDVDMSPDLRNARVKISTIGDRKDKISAVRWLKSNARGLRHELAQRNRQMKRIPILTFDHVDVGAATDMMVKIERLRAEREVAEDRRRAEGESVPDEEGGFDFAASDEGVWDDDGEIDTDEEDVWDDDELADDDEDDDDLEAAWAAETENGGR